MKRAYIKQVRTGPDGRRLLRVCCPRCEHLHWLDDTTAAVRCPRRPSKAPFVIAVAAR